MKRWLEQGSRVPREGEDRLRLCASERTPHTLDRAALGCGQELPFTHLPVGVSQPSGPRKCSHRTSPLGHLQGCYPVGLEACGDSRHLLSGCCPVKLPVLGERWCLKFGVLQSMGSQRVRHD